MQGQMAGMRWNCAKIYLNVKSRCTCKATEETGGLP